MSKWHGIFMSMSTVGAMKTGVAYWLAAQSPDRIQSIASDPLRVPILSAIILAMGHGCRLRSWRNDHDPLEKSLTSKLWAASRLQYLSKRTTVWEIPPTSLSLRPWQLASPSSQKMTSQRSGLNAEKPSVASCVLPACTSLWAGSRQLV